MRDRAWNPYTPMSPPRFVQLTLFLVVFHIHCSLIFVLHSFCFNKKISSFQFVYGDTFLMYFICKKMSKLINFHVDIIEAIRTRGVISNLVVKKIVTSLQSATLFS